MKNLHMTTLPRQLVIVLTTAWIGSLWAIGYLAVPVLFSVQPDRQLAGMLAGHLFDLVHHVGLICAACLLLQRGLVYRRNALRMTSFTVTVAMLLLTLIIHYGIQPEMADLKAQALPLEVMQSAFADRFKLLHGISSILYLAESLLGIWLVLKVHSEK